MAHKKSHHRVHKSGHKLSDPDPKSVLDYRQYTRDRVRIFPAHYETPTLNDAQQPLQAYHDPTAEDLRDNLPADGPIHVYNMNAIKDTQYDPLNGIPRPGHYKARHEYPINEKDGKPYYDSVGPISNVVRDVKPEDKTFLYDTPVQMVDSLEPNPAAETEQMKRLIQKPGMYYDPTVLSRVSVDPLDAALAADAARIAEDPPTPYATAVKNAAAKEGAIQSMLGFGSSYSHGYPDHLQYKAIQATRDIKVNPRDYEKRPVHKKAMAEHRFPLGRFYTRKFRFNKRH